MIYGQGGGSDTTLEVTLRLEIEGIMGQDVELPARDTHVGRDGEP
jgi:hypothetical protein